jgi:hypothetical protein
MLIRSSISIAWNFSFRAIAIEIDRIYSNKR